ncbi:hypothetical protein [Streptomyces sp. AS58]|uniref:hypothetical protein n=1 Tax=Streptomyces sp. AS58 TaxID=1519489 RepID=UPI000A9E8BBD|nr:hypothetical protein [Streptomyces sp. AS58]
MEKFDSGGCVMRFAASCGRQKWQMAALSLGVGIAVLTGCDSMEDSEGPSAQQMALTLEGLLPEGDSSQQQGHGVQEKSGDLGAKLHFRRNGKTSTVSVALRKLGDAKIELCPDTAYFPFSRCTVTRLPDGAKLAVNRSPEDDSHPSGPEIFTAVVTYAGGKQVMVAQTDVRSNGEGPADVKESPLTQEQVTAIATSTVWTPIFSKMPEPPEQPLQSPVMTGQQIARTITSLLPAGLRATDPGGSDGFGHVVADDGHGKGLVAVNVQKWDPHDEAMKEVFKQGSKTLADGTRIRIAKGPALGDGKNAVEWTVDTLRKDGFRVVIMTVNAKAYKLPAGRSEPPLTIQQLRQIALSGVWRSSANLGTS